MKMPIDTSAIEFVSAGPPDPVLDYETRTQKVDMNGKPLFNVQLFGITETSRDSISVKVPGKPKVSTRFRSDSRTRGGIGIRISTRSSPWDPFRSREASLRPFQPGYAGNCANGRTDRARRGSSSAWIR